jgi:glyoxylase-like metal-dependent hydrolase (beta-lactamase superfamily II)
LIVIACWQPTTIVRHPIKSGPHGVGCAATACGDPGNVVSITYLGISGLLIEHDGHVLLTDPFFSNPVTTPGPGVLRWLLEGPRIAADSAVIEKLLPRSADRASTILVGHGHYDHLMDVPYIATHRARSAVIFGGPSIHHMLKGDPDLRSSPARLVAIPLDKAGTSRRDGEWRYSADSAFRFMALIAGHAPTFMIGQGGYTFAEGRVWSDLDRLPRFAAEWKLGEPYAYLIDVLSQSNHTTLFRIYFEDAPSEPPLGFPSATLLASRRVDLAVLCAATSSNVDAAPERLVRLLKPGAVMVTHWESFFRSRLRPPALSHVTDLREFSRGLRRSLPPQSGWVMPLPEQTIRFRTSSR